MGTTPTLGGGVGDAPLEWRVSFRGGQRDQDQKARANMDEVKRAPEGVRGEVLPTGRGGRGGKIAGRVRAYVLAAPSGRVTAAEVAKALGISQKQAAVSLGANANAGRLHRVDWGVYGPPKARKAGAS